MPLNLENIDAAILLQNNSPIDDFGGLSATEMHHLLYDTFGEKSLLSLRNDMDDSTLDHMPFFRLTEEFLKIIQRECFTKLTTNGALPRKILHELYGHRFITDQMIETGVSRLNREIDSAAITSMHINTQLAGLAKKANTRMSLTKSGENLLTADNRQLLFRAVLTSYTTKFNWGSNDAYPRAPIGQLGWGYTAYLLHKFGESEQTMQLYSDKYLQAFPKFLHAFPKMEHATPEKLFVACYRVRTFDRFLEWFGFVEIGQNREKVKPTEVFARVIRFD